ncbi:MAG TPA: hypothetical protein VGM21_07935 [Actinomycetota bacterium]|jgi:hypothetical protein
MRKATLAHVLVRVSVICLLLASAQPAAAPPARAGAPPPRDLAAYEWTSVSRLSQSEARRRFGFLRANGFRTVYLDLGNYLDVADQPENRGRQVRLALLRRALARYVADASSYGVAVHAVGGGPSWTGEERRYLGSKLVQLVADYNQGASKAERLGGVQLDIEPYVEASFYDDTQASLSAYLDTLQGIAQTYRSLTDQPGNDHLQLGFAIPFWFDGEPGAPGPVWWGGAAKPATFHLLDMLRDLPDAYVLVMSYRNVATGPDGSIQHARGEFDYARQVGVECGLVVGQQFGDVQPRTITFYGVGRRPFARAADQIVAAFGGAGQFRGVSVDNLTSYMYARP